MTNLTSAERLILAFENMPPRASLTLDQVAPFIRGLGGSMGAVEQCRSDASLCAYISALTIRYVEAKIQ